MKPIRAGIVLGLSLSVAPLVWAKPMAIYNTNPLGLAAPDKNGHLWGTDAKNGKQAQQVVNYRYNSDGSIQPIPYSGSYIPGLKPKSNAIKWINTGHVEQVWPLPDGSVLFASQIFTDTPTKAGYSFLYKLKPKTNSVGNNAPHYNNKQPVLYMGARNEQHKAHVGVLHNRSLLVATINKATVLFYGEYNFSGNGPVALWKSTNMGDSWTKVVEWNSSGHQTGRIYSVLQNPYNGWIYLTLGDNDDESAIIAWDGTSAPPPNNTPLNKIGNYPGWKVIAGSSRVRTGDLVFTPQPNGKCIWVPTVFTKPEKNLFSQSANYDLTGLKANGVVPYTNKAPAILGFRDNNQKVIYWASYQQGDKTPISLWSSENGGASWSLSNQIPTHNNWISVPQNLYISNNKLVISGRDLELHGKGNSFGSYANFIPLQTTTNQSPTASNDNATTTRDKAVTINILANDTDPQGKLDPNSIKLVAQPQHGQAEILNGSIRYTPNRNFAGGLDSFNYTVKNQLDVSSNPAKVNVFVRVLADDKVSTNPGQAVSVDVLANDVLLNSDKNNITLSKPTHGTATTNLSRTITYTPAPGFTGTDSFTYTIGGGHASAAVWVTVGNKKIQANNDSYTITANDWHGQFFDFPAATGVGGNDTPNLAETTHQFKVTSPIKRISGTGKATISLDFRSSGGFNGILRTEAATAEGRMTDKRGVYQFRYIMVFGNEESNEATATITVN
jgi:Bacterial Ig domain